MVFSSLPAYLDPSNWQQQPIIQAETSNSERLLTSSHLLPPPPLPPPPPQPHGGNGGMGTIRPGSMADRARLANIPMPEAALKCPRCESTNTKFCYFNNYSLSQPRHFCKTCRRYWTRGGALRNVPVGGGCRRNNKRSSKAATTTSTSSKSPVVISSPSGSSSNSGASDIYSSLGISPSQLNPLRFMAPMAHFGHHDQFINYGANNNDLNFQIGNLNLASNSNNGGSSSLPIISGLEQWRLQHQLQVLGGSDSNCLSTGLLPFEAGGVNDTAMGYGGIMNNFKPKISNSVKMEDSNVTQEVNLSRQFLGLSGNEHNYNWSNHGGSSAWTDLSSFSSSSTSNH